MIVRSPDAPHARHRDLLRIGVENPTNCDVVERTADGVVGRCWFGLDGGFDCPRHGDIRRFTVATRADAADVQLPPVGPGEIVGLAIGDQYLPVADLTGGGLPVILRDGLFHVGEPSD